MIVTKLCCDRCGRALAPGERGLRVNVMPILLVDTKRTTIEGIDAQSFDLCRACAEGTSVGALFARERES